MLKITDKKNMLPLVQYKNLRIEKVLDYDDKTLTFSIYIDDMPALLKEENYIQTSEDEFVIKSIEYNTDTDNYDITAALNIEKLEGKAFENFNSTEQTVKATCDTALSGTGWTCECNLTKKRTVRLTNKSAWEVIKQIIKTFRVEVKIDSVNKKLTFVEKRGQDRGVYFTTQLNLKNLNKKSDTNDFYTRILPLGKDGLTVASVNGGSRYIENHQYSSKMKTIIWKDERYTIAQSLYDDANAKLDDYSKPYKCYECKVVDLAKANKEYSLLAFTIGDTVTVIDSKSGLRDKLRIVRTVEYPDEPEQNTCVLGNMTLTFEEYSAKYDDTSDAVDNVMLDDGTIDGNCVSEMPASNVYAYVQTKKMNVTEMFTSVSADIGTLNTTKLNATDADIKYAKIEKVDAIEGKFDKFYANEFKAATADISDLTVDVEKVNTLMFGNASGGSLTTEFSNSVVSMIGDAQIKSAMIKDIVADKITSGKLYTNLVEIVSKSGNLNIADNTIQIKDDNKVARVQIGKDASNDYNMYVWDKTGRLMFDALGLTDKGIQRAIIRNDMVSDTANISAKKLDITSLFTEINGSEETIKSSRIYVDDKAQTLDVAFKSVTTAVTETVTKVDTANANASSALSKADSMESDLKTVTEKVSSQGTSLSLLQGQISNKVWQEDIDTATSDINETVTLLSNKYTSLNQSLTSLTATVNSNTTAISKKADGSTVSTLQTNVTQLTADLSGFKTTVSSTYATKSSLSGYATTSAVNTAINQKADSITQSVSATYATKNSLNEATKSINAKLELKVDTEKLISCINAAADEIKLTSNRLSWSSTYSSMDDKGNLYCKNITINGGKVAIDNGIVTDLDKYKYLDLRSKYNNNQYITTLTSGLIHIDNTTSGFYTSVTADDGIALKTPTGDTSAYSYGLKIYSNYGTEVFLDRDELSMWFRYSNGQNGKVTKVGKGYVRIDALNDKHDGIQYFSNAALSVAGAPIMCDNQIWSNVDGGGLKKCITSANSVVLLWTGVRFDAYVDGTRVGALAFM